MPYITLKNLGEDSFEEKKSVFTGHAKRVETEEEAIKFIDEIKSKNKQAKHNCYAYIIGDKMEIQRYTDDGEPQGTAGIPILDVLKKEKIVNAVIVVTRYFGGILLGTGGLTRAYVKGASIAIKSAGVINKVLGVSIKFKVDYDLFGKIQYICNQKEWYIENITYTENVAFEIIAEKETESTIEKEIINISNGKVEISKGYQAMYFKENNRLFCEI